MAFVYLQDLPGMRIVDVWESSEQQDRFRHGGLMPAIQQAGVPLTEAPPAGR